MTTRSHPEGSFGWVVRRPSLILWALFLATQPFYIFSSGMPQPGDLLLLPLIPFALAGWNGRLRKASITPLRVLGMFTLWVCLVNIGWMVVSGKVGVMSKDSFSILQPAFYIYNSLIVFVALVLFHKFDRAFVVLTLQVIVATALLNVAISLVYFGSRATRGTIFFNNPNQLGYYAMISACIIALCQRQLQSSLLRVSVGLTACMYLALISASKAAVGGTALLFALAVITNPRVIILIALATGGLLLVGGPISRGLEVTLLRIAEDRNPNASFFEERGYDRVEDNMIYVAFGAGEGATTRFSSDSLIGTHEIHSSLATLLFAYGIPGIGMFLYFIYRVTQGASIRMWLILLPSLAYTVAHQGLRFNSLWVLLALFIAVKQLPIRGSPQVVRL